MATVAPPRGATTRSGSPAQRDMTHLPRYESVCVLMVRGLKRGESMGLKHAISQHDSKRESWYLHTRSVAIRQAMVEVQLD